jgi:type IV pilus assembly protein PilF
VRTIGVVALLTITTAGCAVTPQPVEKPTADPAVEINTQLGIEYLRTGRTDLAREKLAKAQRLDPSYAPVYNGLGLLHERVGDLDQADAAFRHAIRLDPSDANYRNNYGTYLCRRRRPDEADAQFRKALEDKFYQTLEIVYTNAGICAASKPDLAKAEAYFRAALDANPKFAPALLRMARLSFERGDHAAVRGWLTRFWQQTEPSPETLLLAAQNETAAGQSEAATEYAHLLRERFPDSPEVHLLFALKP